MTTGAAGGHCRRVSRHQARDKQTLLRCSTGRAFESSGSCDRRSDLRDQPSAPGQETMEDPEGVLPNEQMRAIRRSRRRTSSGESRSQGRSGRSCRRRRLKAEGAEEAQDDVAMSAKPLCATTSTGLPPWQEHTEASSTSLAPKRCSRKVAGLDRVANILRAPAVQRTSSEPEGPILCGVRRPKVTLGNPSRVPPAGSSCVYRFDGGVTRPGSGAIAGRHGALLARSSSR